MAFEDSLAVFLSAGLEHNHPRIVSTKNRLVLLLDQLRVKAKKLGSLVIAGEIDEILMKDLSANDIVTQWIDTAQNPSDKNIRRILSLDEIDKKLMNPKIIFGKDIFLRRMTNLDITA